MPKFTQESIWTSRTSRTYFLDYRIKGDLNMSPVAKRPRIAISNTQKKALWTGFLAPEVGD